MRCPIRGHFLYKVSLPPELMGALYGTKGIPGNDLLKIPLQYTASKITVRLVWKAATRSIGWQGRIR